MNLSPIVGLLYIIVPSFLSTSVVQHYHLHIKISIVYFSLQRYKIINELAIQKFFLTPSPPYKRYRKDTGRANYKRTMSEELANDERTMSEQLANN